MSYMLDDKEKMAAEEDRHATIGGCIAFVLALVVIPLICWGLGTYTSGGRIVTAHAVLFYSYYGIPPLALTAGIPEIARQSCALEQTRPANLEAAQAQLTARYASRVDAYNHYFNVLTGLRLDTSWHQEPGRIPGNLQAARLIYCAQ